MTRFAPLLATVLLVVFASSATQLLRSTLTSQPTAQPVV